MIDDLVAFDRKLLLTLNGSDSPYVDGVWWAITHPLTWLVFFLAMLYVIHRTHALSQTLLIVLSVGVLLFITDQLSAHLIKPLVARPRPTHDAELAPLVHVVRGCRGALYSFVSGHATNGFAVATFLALHFRRWQASAVLFTWASLSSYSRIYLGLHFPLDILCGTLLGVLMGYLIYIGSSRLMRRISLPQRRYAARQMRPIVVAFCLTLVYVMCSALVFTTQ